MKAFRTKTKILTLKNNSIPIEVEVAAAKLATCKLHAIRQERERLEALFSGIPLFAILDIDAETIGAQ